MQRTLFLAGLCLLTALPGEGAAQAQPAAAGPRQAAFPTLNDSQWVRLASPELGRRQGRLLERGARLNLS